MCSIYDYEDMTLQELLCAFYEDIENIKNFINGVDVENHVKTTLEKWLEDGTLDTILNDLSIFKTLSEKVQNNEIEISNINQLIENIDILINNNTKEITDIKEEIENLKNNGLGDTSKLDITNKECFYLTQTQMHKTTVTQGIGFDHVNREIYSAQVYVATDWENTCESFVVNRCKSNGELIDYMILKFGGHGTTFGIENENGKVYIWFAYNVTDCNGNSFAWQLGRIEYSSGLKTIYDFEIIGHFSNDYVVCNISPCQNYIALRYDNRKIEIRLLKDVKQGINRPLSTFYIPVDVDYLQGFALDNERFYWRSGDTNELNYPDLITCFDWSTGEELYRKRNNTGERLNDFSEPEGIAIVEINGQQSLLLAQVKNPTLRRSHMLYMYGTKDSGLELLGLQNDNVKLLEDTWKAKVPNLQSNKLSDTNKAGWYYITTENAQTFTDHPQPDGGGWLFVSPTSDNGKAYYQQYIRSTTIGQYVFSVYRYINDGSVGDWGGYAQELTLYEGDTRNISLNTSIALSDSLSKFDECLIVYYTPSGINETHQDISLKYISGLNISKNCMNMDDTAPSNVAFWEHNIELSSDMTSFKVTKRNKAKFENSGFTGSTDDKEIGIHRIVGIRK